MLVLIAPNAFKGSLTAVEAAHALRAGVRSALPETETELLPISDGGDGLMECLLSAKGGRRVSVLIRGPMGESRRAQFALLKNGTAVIEMARASGLALVPKSKRDPLRASSYGTGQLIDAALKKGARKIIVGLGGSATNDGGAGMAQALGCRLRDAQGRELEPGAEALLNLSRVDARALRSRLKGVRVVAVSDVTNPLTGPRGSARVYGPQKGATPKIVRMLERALSRYARILKRDLGADVAKRPGAGAAGGLGAGLMAFLGAELVPGARYVLKELRAGEIILKSDAAVTGEGRLDATSFYGKAPVEFSRMALASGLRVAAVCATLEEAVRPRLKSAGICEVVTLGEAGASPRQSFSRAGYWAAKAAALAVKRLLLASLLLGLAVSARAATVAEIDRLYFHRDQGKNLEESLSQIELILKANPDDPALLWRQGRGLLRLGENQETRKAKLEVYERAETALRKSVGLSPDNAEAHFWLGVAMGRRGQTRGMLRSLFLVGPIRREMQAALRIDPHHGGAHHVLGEILMELPGFAGGSKREALKEFEAAVTSSPNYTVNYVSLAEAYAALGDKSKAEEVLNRMFLVKDPEDPAEYPENVSDARELLKKLGP